MIDRPTDATLLADAVGSAADAVARSSLGNAAVNYLSKMTAGATTILQEMNNWCVAIDTFWVSFRMKKWSPERSSKLQVVIVFGSDFNMYEFNIISTATDEQRGPREIKSDKMLVYIKHAETRGRVQRPTQKIQFFRFVESVSPALTQSQVQMCRL